MNLQRNTSRVFLYGCFALSSGYGVAGLAYLDLLRRAGLAVTPVSVEGLSLVDTARCVSAMLDEAPGDAWHIWHTEPAVVERLDRGCDRLIVLTTWEADALSGRYVEALNRAAEVWVPSYYNQDVFERQLNVPVFRIPHPVRELAPPRFSPGEFDREMDIPENACVFTTIGTWQERKNLAGVVEAFLRAFPRERDAVLMVKTSFCFTPEAIARMQIAEAIARVNPPNPEEAAARIKIYPNCWPEECISSLMQRADCYVSLHRGEGWCYPLFDAACKGTPVIATGYSGPMDYLDPKFHRLVRHSLTSTSQVGQAMRFGFDSTMRWAQPSVEHCAEMMREVYGNRTQARELATAASFGLRNEYAAERIGEMARLRLAELEAGVMESAHRVRYPAAVTIPCMA